MRTEKRAVASAAGALAILALGQSLAAQELRLTKDAEFPEAFALLSTAREMPDGRVMIADPLGQTLAILDLDSGSMEVLGREGPGPDEYRQPDAVYALPGDSTLLVDLGNGRLTVLDPNGGFGRTTPIAVRQGGRSGPGSFQMMLPRSVDRTGRIYFAIRGGFGPADSIAIGRYDARSEVVDTVARVKGPDIKRSGDGQNVRVRQVPMSAQDDWAIGPDGTVALVRADGYYVQVVHPDGRVTTGPKVEHRLIRPGDAEKLAWVDAQRSAGLALSVEAGPGGQRISMSRGGAGRPEPDIKAIEWPSRMPAFRAGGTIVDPRGRVWVARTTRAGALARYDLFDGEGAKTGEITLEPNSAVIGFGNGTAYVVRTDELGLQWLERYRMS